MSHSGQTEPTYKSLYSLASALIIANFVSSLPCRRKMVPSPPRSRVSPLRIVVPHIERDRVHGSMGHDHGVCDGVARVPLYVSGPSIVYRA